MYLIDSCFLIFILLLFVYSIFNSHFKKEMIDLFTLVFFVFSIAYFYEGFRTFQTEFQYLSLFKVFILLASLGFIRSKMDGEYGLVMSLTVFSIFLFLMAKDLFVFYLSLEFLSLASYVLASYDKHEKGSTEAGMKYFVLGALASGFLLFGLSLIYGLTGLTEFEDIFGMKDSSKGVLMGVIFVLVGLFFKLGAAPFHSWIPDVYEGAPKSTVGFFATVPKLAMTVVALKWCLAFSVSWLVIGTATLSLLLGGFGALYQTRMKRLLGYSSITNIGFLLIGIAVSTELGKEAALVYLMIYVLSNLVLFTFLLSLNSSNPKIEEFKALGIVHPSLAFVVGVSLFSTAGIPPLFGFLGKLMIFKVGLGAGLYGLVFLGIIISTLAAVYYLRFIKTFYFVVNPVSFLSIEVSLVSSYVMAIGTMVLLFGIGFSSFFHVSSSIGRVSEYGSDGWEIVAPLTLHVA